MGAGAVAAVLFGRVVSDGYGRLFSAACQEEHFVTEPEKIYGLALFS
jgi:hypothetical protein